MSHNIKDFYSRFEKAMDNYNNHKKATVKMIVDKVIEIYVELNGGDKLFFVSNYLKKLVNVLIEIMDGVMTTFLEKGQIGNCNLDILPSIRVKPNKSLDILYANKIIKISNGEVTVN
jgi:hypothetical protein